MSNGLYTSGILKYIGEPEITAIQMFQKVTAYVQEESNGIQLPWLSSSLTGDIYFVKDSSSMPVLPEIDKKSLYVPSISKLPERSDGEVSLAILPFNNLTGDESNSWLVTGQYETLLNELSKLSVDVPLRVVSRGTVRRLKYYEMSTQEIARQIGVDYLVEGSLLSFKDSIILQLRLVQVIPNEKVVWANSFTSDVSNILRLHSSIAAQIAGKLDWGDQGRELLANKTTSQEPRQVNPEAYKAYLRGMHNIRQPEEEKKSMGLKMLREAVNLDPADPFAYAALALGYLEIEHTGLDPEGDALMKAEASARQAFRLDSTMVDVLAAMSEVYLYQTHEFGKALEYFKRTLALNPNRAATHYHYSWALYLLGDKEGAIREHELAVKFDPLNPYYVAWMGGLYAFYGEYDKAFQELTNASLISEDYYLCYSLGGYIYRMQGRYDEAIRIHKLLVRDTPWMIGPLGASYAAAGDTINAEKIMVKLEADISPSYAFQLAIINAILGRVDEAFKWLDYKPRSSSLPWIAIFPPFNSLHGDPRFDELVKSFNFPKIE
jgi:TolB-like protein/Flp pilus assembly protein TadD